MPLAVYTTSSMLPIEMEMVVGHLLLRVQAIADIPPALFTQVPNESCIVLFNLKRVLFFLSSRYTGNWELLLLLPC